MEKVLFDTDIGTDIDDALALAYLLCQPECDLLGVTTVSGDVTARAKLVSAVCKRAGRNLPIYPGCSDSIATPIGSYSLNRSKRTSAMPKATTATKIWR